jgi:hypothetical protein
VYATFVVILVFAPVLALSGVHGALFRPLGLAYILATPCLAGRGAHGHTGHDAHPAGPPGHQAHAGGPRLAQASLRAGADVDHGPARPGRLGGGPGVPGGGPRPLFGATFLPEFGKGTI